MFKVTQRSEISNIKIFFIIPEVRNFGVSLILNALSRYPILELLNLKIIASSHAIQVHSSGYDHQGKLKRNLIYP